MKNSRIEINAPTQNEEKEMKEKKAGKIIEK